MVPLHWPAWWQSSSSLWKRRSKACSILIPLKVKQVISTRRCDSAAESDCNCRVLLKLSVTFSTLSQSLIPNSRLYCLICVWMLMAPWYQAAISLQGTPPKAVLKHWNCLGCLRWIPHGLSIWLDRQTLYCHQYHPPPLTWFDQMQHFSLGKTWPALSPTMLSPEHHNTPWTA